jgi:hypothetical protein
MWAACFRSWVGTVLVATAGVGTGCVTADGLDNKLRDASTAYNRSLRWGDADRAAGHLPVEAQKPFLANHEDFEQELVIVDYELTRLDLDKQSGIAASRAVITWHTADELIVKTTVVDQAWQYHEGDFVLVDERRAGGVPLGLFAEVQEDPHPYLPGLEAYRKAHEIGQENKKKRRKRRRRSQSPDRATAQARP